MVRFYIATLVVHVAELLARLAIHLSGGEGYIDVQFEVPLDQPPYTLIGMAFFVLALSMLIWVL